MMSLIVLSLSLVGQVAAGEKTVLQVYEEYDRIPDRTTLSVDLGRVEGTAISGLELAFYYVYPGKRRPSDGAVLFMFHRSGKDWLYLNYRELTLLVDGARVRGEPSHSGKVFIGGVSETMPVIMKATTLLDIAGVKDFEGKLGHTEFKLSDAQMASIREFAKCIETPSYDPNKKRLENERLAAIEKAASEKKAADAETRAMGLKAAEAEKARAKTASDAADAEKLFQEARTLDRASKTVKAVELYRSVTLKYPDTEAAAKAETRLKAIRKMRR